MAPTGAIFVLSRHFRRQNSIGAHFFFASVRADAVGLNRCNVVTAQQRALKDFKNIHKARCKVFFYV
jgi:hypothetical protein